MNAAKKSLKARIRAQGVGDRLDRKINQPVVMLVNRSVEIQESIVFVAEAARNDCQVECRHIPLVGKHPELAENADGASAVA